MSVCPVMLIIMISILALLYAFFISQRSFLGDANGRQQNGNHDDFLHSLIRFVWSDKSTNK